jgi:hypothetical protein
MNDNFFGKVQTIPTVLSSGALIELPVRYYDWSWMNALFPASASMVQRLLPSHKLKPILLMPGTALVAMTAMEYRQIVDVAPYNEFSIGVPVQYEPSLNISGLPVLLNPLLSPQRYRKFGVYIHHLPVKGSL